LWWFEGGAGGRSPLAFKSTQVNFKVKIIGAFRLRKVIYRGTGVLTSKVVQESISSILDSLKRSKLEEAKQKIQALMPEVKTDRQRGELLAASGIYSSMAKAKEGTMQTWDAARIERAARSVTASQLADEFDTGYAETLLNYAKLTESSQQTVA